MTYSSLVVDVDPMCRTEQLYSRPGAARRLVTFLARPRKVTKGRPPRCRAHVMGNPVLPDSMWRLRNSTWRGTHNVPHCGTRTVLVENPLSSRAARRDTRGSKTKQQHGNSLLPFLRIYSVLSPHSSVLQSEHPKHFIDRPARFAPAG